MLVNNPGSTLMRAGEACWVYCQGGSDYQGPLGIKLAYGKGLVMRATSTAVTLSNHSRDPIQIDVLSETDQLPLAYLAKTLDVGQLQMLSVDLPARYRFPVLEPGQTAEFRLQARRDRMATALQSTLLRLSSDAGVTTWIPVVAYRENVPLRP